MSDRPAAQHVDAVLRFKRRCGQRLGLRDDTPSNAAARAAVERLLTQLSGSDRDRLLGALATVEHLLASEVEPAPAPAPDPAYTLRPPRPGDMGWIIHRHGVLYHREYGWDERFEVLVAEVVVRFMRHFDPQRERCWIAERGDERLGSVCLVRHPERDGVARLRLLLVEPGARGLGIGKRLVQECTRFARAAGYHTITLWTDAALHAARRLYEAEGYRLVHEEPHDTFGEGLLGQTWELTL